MSQTRHILPVLIVLSLLWWCAGCGGSGSDNDFQTDTNTITHTKNQNKNSLQVKKITAPNLQKGPYFKEIKFISDTVASEDLEAEAVLADRSGDSNARISYWWIVNGEEIPGITGNILPKRYFKTNDQVYCIVTVEKEGELARTLKSKFVRISGMMPILNLAPVGNFTVPGEFRYKIRASLPTTEEFFQEQEPIRLKYQLISPLDLGIKLDPETGVITWDIPPDTVETYGNKIEITFKVINPKGGEVTSSIALTFSPTEPAGKKEAE
jgi:hypothetical protein